MNKKFVAITIACIIFLCCTVWLGCQYININLELKNAEDNFLIVKNELESANNLLQTTQNELIEAKENIQAEIDKSVDLNNKLNQAIDTANTISAELAVANIMIEDLKKEEYELVYMGDFQYTYYCNEAYEHICGYGMGLTASGKPTEVGWTVAADTSVLPMGSIIYVEGFGFREVMDIGGGVDGKHIDILVDTHQQALDMGVDSGGIWILIKKDS